MHHAVSVSNNKPPTLTIVSPLLSTNNTFKNADDHLKLHKSTRVQNYQVNVHIAYRFSSLASEVNLAVSKDI